MLKHASNEISKRRKKEIIQVNRKVAKLAKKIFSQKHYLHVQYLTPIRGFSTFIGGGTNR